EADVALVAIGRVPYTESLGLDVIGLKLDDRGRVVVDRRFATSVPGIFAIGDVISGPILGPKGGGAGGGGAGNTPREEPPRKLRRDSECYLHVAGSGFGRQDRGGAQSCPCHIQCGEISLHGQRSRQG